MVNSERSTKSFFSPKHFLQRQSHKSKGYLSGTESKRYLIINPWTIQKPLRGLQLSKKTERLLGEF